jgi:alkanesulfonate monooxygenase SsuD/methylene tetrahydromethanopterin reductase-like flavin-dependent oxidoreductase (luciferase family)
MANHQLIGTPEQVAEGLASYAEIGISGVLLASGR